MALPWAEPLPDEPALAPPDPPPEVAPGPAAYAAPPRAIASMITFAFLVEFFTFIPLLIGIFENLPS